MSTTSYQTYKAIAAYQHRSACPPFSMPAMSMYIFAASIIIIKTDVTTSVSLFVLIASLILVSFVLITLLLMGLTGLIGLESLVRQMTKLATRAVQGD